MPQIGKKAPTFTAPAYVNGQMSDVSLESYRGKWVVLFFYPLDFTFVCPTEIKGFNAAVGEFDKLNTQLLALSVDSVYSHQAWVQNGLGEVNFPMVSDITHRISRDYGVLFEEKGISYRGVFVIDPEGVLRSYAVNDLPVGRSVEEVLRLVQAFQSGELCPVGWTPGQATLGKA
jgi:peroxiredoxin (alkyl hydroperoxide reductase subunit C)